MRQLRRTVSGLLAAAATVVVISGCGTPAFTYAADSTDHAYFKVPASWLQVSPHELARAQANLLGAAPAGSAGGAFDWSRAYTPTINPALSSLLSSSAEPVVYASVQSVGAPLRAELSFDLMRNLLFPVTPSARQAAASAGENLPPFMLVSDTTITTRYGMRGINELYEFDIGGQPDAFDQTVLTNSQTTKLYLLLVQCFQGCFLAHQKDILTVINSFTVRGP